MSRQLNPAVQAAAARLGQSRRWGHSPERITEAHRDLTAERIKDYVRKVLADAPPLSDRQRAEVAGLLGAAADGATTPAVA